MHHLEFGKFTHCQMKTPREVKSWRSNPDTVQVAATEGESTPQSCEGAFCLGRLNSIQEQS